MANLSMRNDIIRIKNAPFYAYHGVERDEQNLGGKFEIDVEIQSDLSAAFSTDNLKSTINYESLYAVIEKSVTEKKYYLLETLANDIARKILREFAQVDQVTIKVRKPHPRVKGVVDYVEVEITERRRE